MPHGSISTHLSINGIIQYLAYNFVILYTDDTTIVASGKRWKLEKLCNNLLNKFREWLTANDFKINADKSNHVVFHNVQKLISNEMRLYIKSKRLTKCSTVNILGITLSENLKFYEQCENLLGFKLKALRALM